MSKWYVLCDVCGRKIYNVDSYKRWDGMIVCPNDYESKHPSLTYRPKVGGGGAIPAGSIGTTGDEDTSVSVVVCDVYSSMGVVGYGTTSCARVGTYNLALSPLPPTLHPNRPVNNNSSSPLYNPENTIVDPTPPGGYDSLYLNTVLIIQNGDKTDGSRYIHTIIQTGVGGAKVPDTGFPSGNCFSMTGVNTSNYLTLGNAESEWVDSGTIICWEAYVRLGDFLQVASLFSTGFGFPASKSGFGFAQTTGRSIIDIGGTFVTFGASTEFTVNTVAHVAIQRVGTVAQVFINGVSKQSSAVVGASMGTPDAGWPRVGSVGGVTTNNFRFDMMRVTIGIVRYSIGFTPPTYPLPIA